MKKGFLIAIDGPVASGKGTIAKSLSLSIHAVNLNSGGMYRAYALKLLRKKVGFDSAAEIVSTLKSGQVEIAINPENLESFQIILEKEDVTDTLFDPEISNAASLFGKHREFVEFINGELRRVAKYYGDMGLGIIMEGRQIGVNVFPDADVKIFLTASILIRSQRRLEQYKVKGIHKTLEEVVEETETRDMQDMEREFGALPRYPEKLGYEVVDDSHLTEDQTLEKILGILRKEGIYN